MQARPRRNPVTEAIANAGVKQVLCCALFTAILTYQIYAGHRQLLQRQIDDSNQQMMMVAEVRHHVKMLLNATSTRDQTPTQPQIALDVPKSDWGLFFLPLNGPMDMALKCLALCVFFLGLVPLLVALVDLFVGLISGTDVVLQAIVSSPSTSINSKDVAPPTTPHTTEPSTSSTSSLAQSPAIDRLEKEVTQRMSGLDGSHDYWHVGRVVDLALHLAAHEKGPVDKEMVHVAALLHDVNDSKYFPKREGETDLVDQWLREIMHYPTEKIAKVQDIIKRVSFRYEMTHDPVGMFPELAIVQDADRLDALGAIGIARAFAYGGSKGSALAGTPDSVLHHFHEKLFLLEGLMKTRRGREIARERHEVMVKFVEQFRKEAREFVALEHVPPLRD